MFNFFRRLLELEMQFRELRVEVDSLKDALDDTRAERDEFKKILFEKSGLVRPEYEPRKVSTPIQGRQPVHKALQVLEQKDREAHWAKKAEEADKILGKEDSKQDT
jgi:hypothetical protein